MITLEDWALIRRLAAEGVPKAQIAARLGISRTTVVKAVASQAPPKYEREASGNAFTVFEEHVRQLITETPTMPATVLAERVGWSGSMSWFRENVARIRADASPKDPADRIRYRAGDQAQCDLWFPPASIPLGADQAGSPPVLVIVASFSRFITARMLPSRTTPDLLAGMWSLLEGQLGAVPRRLIWDNETGIGRGNRFAEGVTGFTGTLATRIQQLRPRDPESKGIVERMNEFFETSFMPGRAFASPHDFNDQLAGWLPRANSRLVRSLRARPIDLIGQDRAAMLPLPPIPPIVGLRTRVRLGRDYYVRAAGNDYSVDPAWIGRMVDVTADLDRVVVTADGRELAGHDRSWASHLTLTDPVHVETAGRMRTLFQQPRAVVVEDPMLRDLADYDRAFGVDLDGRVAS